MHRVNDINNKNITSLIISGSSGIGEDLIKYRLRQGHKVVTTLKDTGKLKDFNKCQNLIIEVIDLGVKTQINKIPELYKNRSLKWNVLIICTGTMLPINSFEEVDFAEWQESLEINFINQMYLIKKVLPYRVKDSKIILFSAGGGKTPLGFSAYNISKIALTKSAEYLDSEIQDCAVISVGPGWVKTKIHKEVLNSGDINKIAYNQTLKRFRDDDFLPKKKLINFFEWLLKQPKNIVGGRNLSISHDSWNEENYVNLLQSNLEIGKLRRFKNSELNFKKEEEQKITTLKPLIKFLASSPEIHSPLNKNYKHLNELSINITKELFSKNSNCIDSWEKIDSFEFSFFEMGNINSMHLFGLDELIIFSYYILNSSMYKNALDIGANIGLHSLILSKLGINTKSYEPDPIHLKQLKYNLEKNDLLKKVEVFSSAISNTNQKLNFCRVKGNTTGSHLVGSKDSPYGELDYFQVNCRDIRELFNEFDLIKLDAEGHEDVILCSLDISNWKDQDIFVEVGSKNNAEKIYSYFMKSSINLFSQKKGWSKVEDIEDMPFSYKEGSLFISKKNKMLWDN